ncbi:hypothetical protein HKX48_008360 [Thoreauomyces humboldtii]|nr:hypothetical protein HKX48_008360 [Thoreauomyces humboldtii]
MFKHQAHRAIFAPAFKGILRRGLATVPNPSARAASTYPVSKVPSEFTITPANGFLPLSDPLVELPAAYGGLEDLLTRMPLTRLDNGKPGLLASGDFGDAIKKELPDYSAHVAKEKDPRVLLALFRDYTFAASAYLLEPCDIVHRKTGGGGESYGLGRDVLPRQLAVPLAAVSAKLAAKPFMEYAQSYALYNYKRLDPKGPLAYDNLALIRGFSGMPSESGFILVHVAMVANTGKQTDATTKALAAAEAKDRGTFDKELVRMREALQVINLTMETMWENSAPGDYMKFRTFIMGTKNQPMFPKGVVYEGVSDQATFYRGESGANDSIVPTLDNFLGVTEEMPDNPMTDILRDFRSYRPENHNLWLGWVEQRARDVGVRAFALKDANSAVLYLSLLDQLREFRARHWNFTKSYILKYSKHPTATGGSPIVTWLPNQLGVVLGHMAKTAASIKTDMGSLTPENRALAEEMFERADTQSRILKREVAELKPDYQAGAAAQDQGETDWTKSSSAAA